MWKAIKWLFCDAPLSITRAKEKRTCDYCGNDDNWTYFESEDKTVCHACLFKALDNSLKENN